MKLNWNSVCFGNYTKTVKQNNILIKEEFNDDDIKILHEEFDVENDRFLRQDKWDNKGNPIQQWRFDYFENKKVEHFNTANEESYVRTITDTVLDNKRIHKEEYISKTTPDNNYIHETIKDLNGKLLSFLCNGKKIL